MLLNRSVTSIVNWSLDNLCPPILRDNRAFMRFIIWFAYGDQTALVMDFKEKLPFLSDDEISGFYDLVKAVPVHRRPTDLNKKSLNFIIENLSGCSVLDVACGRGHVVNYIASKTNMDVTGIDIVVPNSVGQKVHFVKGSMTSLPFEADTFDTILCTHALEHVRESKKALNELFRVAKKRVIIVVPRQREYKYTPDLHINFFPYLYNLQEFIGHKGAKYYRFGNDFTCVIDL